MYINYVLIFFILAGTLPVDLLKTETKRSFTIDYSKNTFMKDGKPFRYISGSIHYFRVPRAAWRDRLQKMRKAGLNAIQTYVPWNLHEMFKGTYNFEDRLDIVSFIKLAQEENLLVILRPGPYICAEWEFGGFPYWLIKEVPTEIRTNNTIYLDLVNKWFSVLLPKIRPLLYSNGGPIISVQVENEYGSYGCDHNYMLVMQHIVVTNLGKDEDVVLFTTDGAGDGYLKCGSISSLFTTVDFGPTTDPEKMFQFQRKYQSVGPLVNSEYYVGWFDHWGEKHHTAGAPFVAQVLDKMLALGASVNMYMFEGGTNFDMFNGANAGYYPVTTSYDYDGPLTEAGDPTEKYFLIQNVTAKYVEIPSGPQPVPSVKGKYGKSPLLTGVTFYDVMNTIKPTESVLPRTFEELDLATGYIMYRTNITGVSSAKWGSGLTLKIAKLYDRAVVLVDKVKTC